MTDIQSRVSQRSHSRNVRRSVLGNPRLELLKHELTVLSDVTFAIFHSPVAGFASGIGRHRAEHYICQKRLRV
jgi:hypothetical protein